MSIKRLLSLGLYLLVAAAISHAQQPTPTPIPAFPLNIGTPVEGNINDNTPAVRYAFEGTAGVNVLLLMETTSGDLDPLLVLRGPDGDEIARNDNTEPGVRDAAISVELPVDGLYTVRATRFEGENGTTSGTFGLLLEVEEATLPDGELDPLAQPPSFSVPFTRLNLREFASGELGNEQPRLYYTIGGDQSDLLRATLTVTNGDLLPAVRVLDSNLTAIGDTIRPRDGEVIAFGTLPRRDWYLIEVTQESGSGAFSLYVDALEGQQLTYNNDTVSGDFGVNTPTAPFTFEGTIGDTIFASAVVTSGGASPEIRLLDIALRPIDSASGTRFASLQTELPRSGTYILQIRNTAPNTTGSFNLRFNALQTGPQSLDDIPAEYNTSYTNTINEAQPLDYYAFQGRRGDIITAEMSADSGTLDPFLILMDDNLNELVVNDNSRGRRDAQISQFPLPADGTYYLLAGRANLANGTTTGDYTLRLTVGTVALTPGSVTARLRWNTDDDLNLFIREPSGRVISWSNPDPPDSGQLQIDSNTNCTTRSAQPVEYIYWPPADLPENGDYEVWVWYQQACGQDNPVSFSFDLTANDDTVLEHQSVTLESGERFNIDIRVSQPDVFVLQPGTVTRPTPQQRASEGGDIPLLMGETVTGSISNDVYARFYQFQGQEGEEITLEARAVTGDLDPVLVLRDNTETNLAQADDISRDNRNARLTHTLPYTGRYVVAVTRFGVRDGLTVGDYRLSLRPADATEYAQAP